MDERTYVKKKVHELYYEEDCNCARTTLICLSRLFEVTVEKQTMDAAFGLHGAGGFRAQCGLVEGTLMMIGILGTLRGKEQGEIVKTCFRYGEAFTEHFGSLTCRELRPGGFRSDDPPHLCESLTVTSILFGWEFLKGWLEEV